MAGKAVKLTEELVEAARAESTLWSRSMTQQVEHWARIGRAIERTGAISHEQVRAALAGELSYDELATVDRMVVLGQLERAVFHPKGNAELAGLLAAEGRPMSTVDAEGRLTYLDPE